MTNEEAVLTLKVVEEYFEKNVPVLGGEAMRMAIDALHAQQSTKKLDRSQWDGCPFCRGKEDDRNDENHILRQRYCDVCGKPLTELAWAEIERRIGGSNGTTDIF